LIGFAAFDPLDQVPHNRCAQCNGLQPDAPLVTGQGFPPYGIHLHQECRKFWLEHWMRRKIEVPGPLKPLCAEMECDICLIMGKTPGKCPMGFRSSAPG
jgi:hypothetical protein